MEEIMKSPQFRYFKDSLDQDFVSDYSFILGDLNYRFDSSYDDMIKTDKIKYAPELIDELDQLLKSRKGGQIEVEKDGLIYAANYQPRYPSYQEAQIDFLPTYKRNTDNNEYKEKKN